MSVCAPRTRASDTDTVSRLAVAQCLPLPINSLNCREIIIKQSPVMRMVHKTYFRDGAGRRGADICGPVESVTQKWFGIMLKSIYSGNLYAAYKSNTLVGISKQPSSQLAILDQIVFKCSRKCTPIY